jgi:hypothetical protein
VLRLMRENGLLSPSRVGKPRGPRVHDGTIIASSPDEMWGTDGTRIWTRKRALSWVFVAVDHHTDECVGIHAAHIGTRFEALEPIRQGVREHFGGIGAGVVRGPEAVSRLGPAVQWPRLPVRDRLSRIRIVTRALPTPRREMESPRGSFAR